MIFLLVSSRSSHQFVHSGRGIIREGYRHRSGCRRGNYRSWLWNDLDLRSGISSGTGSAAALPPFFARFNSFFNRSISSLTFSLLESDKDVHKLSLSGHLSLTFLSMVHSMDRPLHRRPRPTSSFCLVPSFSSHETVVEHVRALLYPDLRHFSLAFSLLVSEAVLRHHHRPPPHRPSPLVRSETRPSYSDCCLQLDRARFSLSLSA